MRLGARIYATTEGFADAAGAVARRGELGEALEHRLEDGLISGYIAGSVTSEAQWDDESVDRAVIDAVTGGALPVVYANLTYDADDERQAGADLRDLLEAFGLRIAQEITPPAR